MYKLYNVCVKCWKKEKYCKCDKKILELIDYNMIYVLSQLNKKGYKTKFSCGGHIEKKFIHIYITFKDSYNFNKLPEGYQYKNSTLFYKNKKLKNIKLMQKDINCHIKILKLWGKEVRVNEN